MIRTTTRSIRTAEAIRDREDFRTSGALYGEETGRMSVWQSGKLSGADYDQFVLDAPYVDYVVWSYSTPIAWHWTSQNPTAQPQQGWHVVSQKFSPTTSKHQSNLYMIKREEETLRLLTEMADEYDAATAL
jgi:hypothetical protein